MTDSPQKLILKIPPVKEILQLQGKKKTQKTNHSSAGDLWENIKSSFKENAITFSKNPTTQENIKTERRLIPKRKPQITS